ncbi:CPBP family intramembrane metalloprotease [Paraburkholderia sp. LEh10]|uniref:CPBP family glutamic-type intramembrane protease n=1 Tax=Paraburkholderia sp. LEh10 TaxID=2821353 RepID=UPI001AEAB546|nr:CPBP family glutamic-type intramembrane protease [Paraburkholderia sp. LEh10]MBP0592238.1 CPBP family intramembrane metalloprotease [Paraburkholderia sp. LEh10]
MVPIFGHLSPAPNPFGGRPLWIELLFTIVLAPLYETLIFQWAIMKLLHGPLRRSSLFAGTASTILFRLGHGLTDWRAFSLIVTSVALAAVFAIESRRAGFAYLAAVSTHGLFNGLVIGRHWP